MNNDHKKQYLDKYPGGRVHLTDNEFDVHCADGHHRVSLRKNGLGNWDDVSEASGCVDKHCLAKDDKASGHTQGDWVTKPASTSAGKKHTVPEKTSASK